MDIKDLIQSIAAQNQKVLVVGMGVSGVASAEFLLKLGIRPVCVERSREADFKAKSRYVERIEKLITSGATVLWDTDGEQILSHLDGVKLAVLSPGVSLESAAVGTIKRAGLPLVSELELGVQLHGGQSVVVTGSNGKSTTVSLIHKFLEEGQIPSYLCGNVGVPVIESSDLVHNGKLASEPSKTVLVVEASSYQLEACSVLKPKVAVLTNISENHLERHGTLKRYAEAKARVFRLQSSEDLLIVNADDKTVMSFASACNARKAYAGFGSQSDLSRLGDDWAAVRYEGGAGTVELCLNGQSEMYKTDNSRLRGRHNCFNVAAAALAARFMGASKEAVQKGIDSFIPLEHRVEFISDSTNPLVINDSKSTTVVASQVAFTTVRETFPEKKVTLMIGGLSKAGSWDPLLKDLKKHQAALTPVICFGKDGPMLASHCKASGIECVTAPRLKEGVKEAFRASGKDGIVLLSPGCASFDEFNDFEHRGREFKRMVGEIANG